MKDEEIFAYALLLTYWNHTETINHGFTEIPVVSKVEETLRGILKEDLSFVENIIKEDPEMAEVIIENPTFIEFLKENTILSFGMELEKIKIFVNEELDTKNFKPGIVKVATQKNFTETFHYNLLINKDLMRIITSTLILNKKITAYTPNDYNHISDMTYSLMDEVFDSLSVRFKQIMTSAKDFSTYIAACHMYKFVQVAINKESIFIMERDLLNCMFTFGAELKIMNTDYVFEVHQTKAATLSKIAEFIHSLKN